MEILLVPGNGSTLLGKLHIEMLDILSVKCNTIVPEKQTWGISEQWVGKKSQQRFKT